MTPIYFDNIIYLLQKKFPLGLCRQWDAWINQIDHILFDRKSHHLNLAIQTRKAVLEDAKNLFEKLPPKSLFISSYFTFPLNIPSVQCVPDLIPEILHWDLRYWQNRILSIQHATHLITISDCSKQDLIRLYRRAP